MAILRHLRHGPLLFWAAAVIALATVSAAAASYTPARTAPVSAAPTAIDVERWRNTATQLPLAASQGTTKAVATALAEAATGHAQAAEASRDADLAAAWQYAATAATELVDTDPTNRDALFAAVRAVGLAGDALVAALNGTPWLMYDTVTPQPVGIDGRPSA
jgi:hypothetical protein